MGMEGEGMGFGFGFGWLFMIGIWVLIGLVVVAMLRAFSGSRKGPGDERKRALDILDERYARGEIDQQEYQRMKQDINEHY